MKYRALRLSIRQKLYVLVLVCMTAALCLAGASIAFSGRVAETARAIDRERFAPLTKLQELGTQLKEVRFRLAGVLLDQMPIPGSRNHLRETTQSATVLWRDFKQAAGRLDAETAALVAAIDAEMPRFHQFAEALGKAYEADDAKVLQALLEDEWPVVQQKIVKPLDAVVPAFRAAVARETGALEAGARRFRDLTAASALAVLLVILALATLVGRSVMSGVGTAMAVAEALARGDLTQEPRERSHDELGQLLSALDGTVVRLRGTIAEVRRGTSAMATSANEVAAGSTDLSQRTEEQASSLAQTASSMEELTTTVQRSAENAARVREVATEAAEVAARGGEVIAQVVSTMNAINGSSRRIMDITGVIDGIAFQTNILALNAAVEAARAGEHGRGFAVVAAEVRILAQRSAASAKEIKQLIDASVHQVQDGTRLVDVAGTTMSQIVSSVHRANDIVGEMAAATRAQAGGLDEVNRAVGQMDHVTQQNAALVEEASAAAESLKQQAQELVRAVAVFRLPGAVEQEPAAANLPIHPIRPIRTRPPVASEPDAALPRARSTRVGATSHSALH
ncbi:MAG TPA: methyl-accepting chemotaxis protein [Ramlibacter sp.]|jgi:methyl-accepting chemotaxis protein|nr:methyl-accepting chemotaxis protein [Ramlibacter sp.]